MDSSTASAVTTASSANAAMTWNQIPQGVRSKERREEDRNCRRVHGVRRHRIPAGGLELADDQQRKRDHDADRDTDRRLEPSGFDRIAQETYRRDHQGDARDRREHLHPDETLPVERGVAAAEALRARVAAVAAGSAAAWQRGDCSCALPPELTTGAGRTAAAAERRTGEGRSERQVALADARRAAEAAPVRARQPLAERQRGGAATGAAAAGGRTRGRRRCRPGRAARPAPVRAASRATLARRPSISFSCDSTTRSERFELPCRTASAGAQSEPTATPGSAGRTESPSRIRPKKRNSTVPRVL